MRKSNKYVRREVSLSGVSSRIWVSEEKLKEKIGRYLASNSVDNRMREIKQQLRDGTLVKNHSYTITVNPSAHREFLIKFNDGKTHPIRAEGLVELELLNAQELSGLASGRRRECVVNE